MDSPTQKSTTGRDASPGRARSFTGGLGFILALVAFSMSGYLWYVLARRDQIIGGHVLTRIESTKNQATETAASIARAEQRIATLSSTQAALAAEVTRLGSGIGQQRQRWALAEAEQLLIIANHRLNLDHEIGLSLAALNAADRALHRMADPRLLPVRHQIAKEIGQLEGMRQLDISGVALRLQSMASTIPGLPLGSGVLYPSPGKAALPQTSTVVPKPYPSRWNRFTAELRGDFSSLIRIQRDKSSRPPLLPRREAYFVRQNIELMLYSAQLALLEHQQAVFQQNLMRARGWLRHYFNQSDPAVARMYHDLGGMIKDAKQLQPPDISASLAALRRVRTEMNRT